MITKEEIENIARLAKLYVKEEEFPSLISQLQQMTEFADTVKNADVNGFVSTDTSPAQSGRADEVKESLPREQVLANAPLCDKEFFVVRKRA